MTGRLQLQVFIFLLLCFSLTQVSVSAQLKKAFSKGTVELQNGQTLQGFVRTDEMPKMNYRIAFKAVENQAALVNYDTGSVKRYRLMDGDVYELLKFRLNDTTPEIPVLAKLISKSKASLYKLSYRSEPIFIVTVDTALYVLRKDEVINGALSTEITYHHFRDILFNALKGATVSADYVERLLFNEKDISNAVNRYNQSAGAGPGIRAPKESAIHYIIAGAGGMIKNTDDKEFYVQFSFRTYIPKISRSTSLNIGLSFYDHRYANNDALYYFTTHYTSTLVTLPVSIQQNILNRKIRPFLFAGINASYWKLVDDNGSYQFRPGFSNNFGVSLLFGGGIELDVYKGLMIKAEYRDENYAHLVLAGIHYIFGKRVK